MKEITIFDRAGAFAENKDIAKELRVREIIPALENNDEVVLNFKGVGAATQSFIHALISELIRKYGSPVLDQLIFKSCNNTIKQVINIVTDYMQEGTY